MSKLDRLWEKFNKANAELEAAKGTKQFKAKQRRLMDIYDKIHQEEAAQSVWGTSKMKKTKKSSVVL